MFAEKLGFNAEILRKTLWGDYYFDPKAKKILKGAYVCKNTTIRWFIGELNVICFCHSSYYSQAKGKKPLFVQFVLETLFNVYGAVLPGDKEKTEKIVSSLKLKLLPRDMKVRIMMHNMFLDFPIFF